MTFTQLDKHVTKYLRYLKNTNALKNIDDIKYHITHSKKSQSFYLKLVLIINRTPYKKTVRFSDHAYTKPGTYTKKMNGIVIDSNRLSKKDIKHVEATIRKEIKKLQYCAHMTVVMSFKVDNYE